MRLHDRHSALTELIQRIDFSAERFFDLYFDRPEPAPSQDVSGEVWTNLSKLTADLSKLRGEFTRLRRGVEDLRLPAIEAVGLDRVVEQLRGLEGKLRGLAPVSPPSREDGQVKRLCKDLLPVLDTIDRVFELMEKQPESIGSSLRTGLDSLKTLLETTLAGHGLKLIKLERGDRFDPQLQMALSTEQSTELADGTVSQVLTKGYLLGDQVLRNAQVVVVRNN